MPPPPEMWDAVERAAVRELKLPESPPGGAYQQLGHFDAYQVTTADSADFERHHAQLAGQFLIDRDGIVRWVNVECPKCKASGKIDCKKCKAPKPPPSMNDIVESQTKNKRRK